MTKLHREGRRGWRAVRWTDLWARVPAWGKSLALWASLFASAKRENAAESVR